MKISSVEIDWRFGHGNAPDLILRVDAIPKSTNYRYKKYKAPISDYTMYIGYDKESDTFNFMAHSPKNETGYNGSIFELAMEQELPDSPAIVKIKGPWSSRPSIANWFLPEPIVGVILAREGEQGGRFSSITVSRAKTLLPEGVYLLPVVTNVGKEKTSYEISSSPSEVTKPKQSS